LSDFGRNKRSKRFHIRITATTFAEPERPSHNEITNEPYNQDANKRKMQAMENKVPTARAITTRVAKMTAVPRIRSLFQDDEDMLIVVQPNEGCPDSQVLQDKREQLRAGVNS
jgi:hypothetical protein